MASRPRPRQSLRAELLVTFGVLTAGALLVATVCVALVISVVPPQQAVLPLVALIAADVVIFVAFGAYQLRRLVARPLGEVVAATEAIAAGDLARRVPADGPRELALLADGINRMTDHLLEEQAGRSRAEKLASVGRLAAGIAHEIGNPLGAIHGYAHLIRRRSGAEPGADEVLDGLEREAARIDRIVRGLLDYARPRRQTPSRVDVNDTAAWAAHLLAEQGALRHVPVALDLDPARPAVVGERHELEQLFVNLLLNAADALGGEGGVAVVTRLAERADLAGGAPRRRTDPPRLSVPHPPTARVASWLARERPPGTGQGVIKVVVADSGPGIPEGDRERVFDPFYTTKEPGKGTGLGLAIVARTVENLGGTVWAQRAREGGAAIHMLFPVAVVAEAAP